MEMKVFIINKGFDNMEHKFHFRRMKIKGTDTLLLYFKTRIETLG